MVLLLMHRNTRWFIFCCGVLFKYSLALELPIQRQCKVLMVADVTNAAPQSEAATLMATMVDLFTGAGANGFNISMAFWRYSRGGSFDGPIPTDFFYDIDAVPVNFGMQGGNLDIISATEALSAWAVDDAVIVLFTGSDQNNINAAGRDYTRKEWTLALDRKDTLAFATKVVPMLSPPSIFDATMELCKDEAQGVSTIPPTMPTPFYRRASCLLYFVLDASLESWDTYETQIDYMRQIGRQAFQISVTSPYQLYARALHVGQRVPSGPVSVYSPTNSYYGLNYFFQIESQYVSLANAMNTTVAKSIELLQAFATDTSGQAVALIFTNSDQSAVDAVQPVSANNLFIYGHAFSGANLKRIAYPVGLALTQTMPKAIDEYCRSGFRPSDNPTFPRDPTPYPTAPTTPFWKPNHECGIAFYFDGSKEGWPHFELQHRLMASAMATMFEAMQDARFLFAGRAGVIGQVGFVPPDFHTAGNTHSYADWARGFRSISENATESGARDQTLANIIAYFQSEKNYWGYDARFFFFSNSPQAEIDAISDISFRENLYGYNLQGADMSRIAKPLTFPLDDEWMSEFRDSCTTPIA